MIVVDRALERRHEEGKPIRVAMVGAGFMARGIALQIITAVRGMRLVAISNRRIELAQRAYHEAGVNDVRAVSSAVRLREAIERQQPAVTDDAMLLCASEGVDAIIEVTGAVEFGARVAVNAIEHGKSVILMNAELDATLGPILKVRADKAGVVFTNADGDQPGVIMNLYRFVKGIGVNPVVCGNIKGLHDPYRNPTTQEEFARKWGQNPYMVTSFADGSKISFEQATVANATGMRVGTRGMHGPSVAPGTPIEEAVSWYPLDPPFEGPGIVDYVVGASPNPGVFVLGAHGHPTQKHYLKLYKLGDGPLYCFYTPYHLCHFEAPNTVARAVLFGDASIAPLDFPRVDVVAAAKTPLNAGQELDCIGGYTTYGLCENSELVHEQNLLPLGVAEGGRLQRAIQKDQILTYDDVDLPEGRLCDQLRNEQTTYFASFLTMGNGAK